MVSEVQAGNTNRYAWVGGVTNPTTGQTPLWEPLTEEVHVGDDGTLHRRPCHCLAYSEAQEHLSSVGYGEHEDVSSDDQELDSQDADTERAPDESRFFARIYTESGYHLCVAPSLPGIVDEVLRVDGGLHFSIYQSVIDGGSLLVIVGTVQDLANERPVQMTVWLGQEDLVKQQALLELAASKYLSELANAWYSHKVANTSDLSRV
jgi:hypothetical protein